MAVVVDSASKPGTWLEVALNGPWTKKMQPNIPVSVTDIIAEGVACAAAGASIIHVHSYDEATGLQADDAETYIRIIEGIREVHDVIVYPTIPFNFEADIMSDASAQRRFAAVQALAERNLIEWTVVDPGSCNLTHLSHIQAQAPGIFYANPDHHIRRGLQLCSEHGVHPGYAIYEPGWLRLGAALARSMPGVPQPIYRFMFSNELLFGFKPSRWALDTYLRMLAEEAPGSPWMLAALTADVAELIPYTVELGGHVRVGLEDARLGETRSNLQLVEQAVQLITQAGSQPTRASEIRAALKHGA
jgi:3-keto-5-aminohexanoate cleavage enzyme